MPEIPQDSSESLRTALANIEENAPFFADIKNEMLAKLIRGRSVLDVGCGRGELSIFLSSKGYEVTALDIDSELVEIARKKTMERGLNIDFIVGDALELSLKKKFDTIVVYDALEHIEDDGGVVERLKKSLSEDGVLIVVSPAFRFLWSPRDDAVGHVRRYSKKGLRRLLEENGLSVLEIRYWKFIHLFIALYCKVAKVGDYPYTGSQPITRFLEWWFRNIENKFPFPIGETFVATAKLRGK